VQMCKDNLAELCSSGEHGVLLFHISHLNIMRLSILAGCSRNKPWTRRARSCRPKIN
jgi:hypothetical protein